jgi:hypothetical protein
MRKEGVQHHCEVDIYEPEKKIESYMDLVDDIKKEKDHQYIVTLIAEYFSHKLFQTITDFAAKKEEDLADAEDYDEEDQYDDEKEDNDYGDENEENDPNFINNDYLGSIGRNK